MLKGIDAEWDDENIDELLAAADASGDGNLQIEDSLKLFVKLFVCLCLRSL